MATNNTGSPTRGTPRGGGQRGIRAAAVAWPEIEARLGNGATAVLPIGAAAKEHGRHLPLATDYIQAEWLAERLAECRDVVVWPTVSYGFYPAFVDYPGSISLSRETFVAVVEEILAGLVRAGAQRIAVLNTGISTIEPLERAIAASPMVVPVQLVNVYAGPRLARVQAEVEDQPWGGHADEIETSLMLAIAPGQVEMRLAEPAQRRYARGPLSRSDPEASNYNPSGVDGDPTLASLAKGERLSAALRGDVLAAIDALLAR